MKAVVAASNQEKALVGAFSVITTLRMELLLCTVSPHTNLITVIVAHPSQPLAVFIEQIFAEQNEMFYISDARTFFS